MLYLHPNFSIIYFLWTSFSAFNYLSKTQVVVKLVKQRNGAQTKQVTKAVDKAGVENETEQSCQGTLHLLSKSHLAVKVVKEWNGAQIEKSQERSGSHWCWMRQSSHTKALNAHRRACTAGLVGTKLISMHDERDCFVPFGFLVSVLYVVQSWSCFCTVLAGIDQAAAARQKHYEAV